MTPKIDREKVRECSKAGMTPYQIAEKFKCSHQYVYAILNGYFDVSLKEIGADRRHRLTDEQIEQIPVLYEQGLAIIDIARGFKVSPPTIRYHLFPNERARNNARSRAWRIERLKSDPAFRERCRQAVNNTACHRRASIRTAMMKGELSK